MKECLRCFARFSNKSTDSYCSPKCLLLDQHTVNERGCWIWKRAIGGDGYGRMRLNKKYIRPHRLSFCVFNRSFDESLQVCHHCDDRKCINPHHLFLGTNTDNQRDKIKKGRGRFYSKLTKEDVVKIRELFSLGEKCGVIAKKFNVCRGTIEHVVYRITWKHIP